MSTISDVMERLIGKLPVQDDEIEFVYDERGRATHFKGLNGKLWRHPCVPYRGDRKLFEAMSVCCCGGHPPLNDQEQEAFEVIYPIVLKFSEQVDEEQHNRLDSMLDDGGNQDSEWWHRKQIGSDSEAFATAYSIAEKLVADGWSKK
jgi:hypothetical protein